MSGISKKIPLPHWQKVMDNAGWETAQEIADITGLPHSTIHRVIFGEVVPSNETILKIAKAARVPAEDIAIEVFKYSIAIPGQSSPAIR